MYVPMLHQQNSIRFQTLFVHYVKISNPRRNKSKNGHMARVRWKGHRFPNLDVPRMQTGVRPHGKTALPVLLQRQLGAAVVPFAGTAIAPAPTPKRIFGGCSCELAKRHVKNYWRQTMSSHATVFTCGI